MMVVTRVALAVAFVLMARPALAHPPPLGIPGFFGGVLHPWFVPAHLIAILGLGLLIGQMQGWERKAPFAFIASLAAGLAIMTRGYVPMLMNELVLACGLVSGALVALARPLPEVAVGCVLAVVLGLAIALDSPPEVVSVREANFMLIGTGFGATLLLMAAVEIASRLRRDWQRLGARILGSWIAASAILVVALRLVR